VDMNAIKLHIPGTIAHSRDGDHRKNNGWYDK